MLKNGGMPELDAWMSVCLSAMDNGAGMALYCFDAAAIVKNHLDHR